MNPPHKNLQCKSEGVVQTDIVTLPAAGAPGWSQKVTAIGLVWPQTDGTVMEKLELVTVRCSETPQDLFGILLPAQRVVGLPLQGFY